MLFDLPTLLAYCAACVLLILSPGPGQALIIARTVQVGTRAGVLTAVGLQIGTLVHTVAAAFGLSVVLATSATAFTVVKYAGAAYLIVLGAMILLRAERTATAAAVAASTPATAALPSDRRLVFHAAVTGILNPKVALFFLAFLPQFVQPARGLVLVQFLVLGLILAVLGTLGDSLVAVVAGRLRGRFLANARFAAWRERATGFVLLAIGLRLAFVARR